MFSISLSQPVYGSRDKAIDGVAIANSGDNVYLTWPSNKTGNLEVLFRASNDSGKSFADKVNLSNSTTSDSKFRNGITTFGDNAVHVSWNDNKTGNVETYVITSQDGGKTFGKAIMVNGTGTGSQGFGLPITSLSPQSDILNDALKATKIATSGNIIYVPSLEQNRKLGGISGQEPRRRKNI